MNEKIWASVGKLIVFLGGLVALILGIYQLNDRFQGPSVYGVAEIRNYNINPEIRKLFDVRIKRDDLIGAIKEQVSKGESPTKILNDIEKSDLPNKSPLLNIELDQYAAFRPLIIQFTVHNTGSELAQDVKLMLPGEGSAEISERAMVAASPKIVNWTGEIPLGNLRPQGVLEVNVWPKMMIAPNLTFVNPALSHSKGTGKIFELHSYYGWDADLAAWYISLGRVAKTILVSSLIFITATILFIARKRGHLVIKPSKGKDTGE